MDGLQFSFAHLSISDRGTEPKLVHIDHSDGIVTGTHIRPNTPEDYEFGAVEGLKMGGIIARTHRDNPIPLDLDVAKDLDE